MEFDEYKYPVISAAGSSGPEARPIELDEIPESDLGAARDLIEEEVRSSISSSRRRRIDHGYAVGEEEEEVAVEGFKTQWLELQKEIMFIPNRSSEGCFDVPATKIEHLSALATNFQALKSKVEKDGKKISKLDSKLNMLTKGYIVRSVKLQENLKQSYTTLGTLTNDLSCSESIFAMEKRMAPLRLQAAAAELAAAAKKERLLQQQYGQIMKIIK